MFRTAPIFSGSSTIHERISDVISATWAYYWPGMCETSTPTGKDYTEITFSEPKAVGRSIEELKAALEYSGFAVTVGPTGLRVDHFAPPVIDAFGDPIPHGPKDGLPIVPPAPPQVGPKPFFQTYIVHGDPIPGGGTEDDCTFLTCRTGDVEIRGEIGSNSGKTTSIAITIEDKKNGFFALTAVQAEADPKDFKALKLFLKMMAEAVKDVR